MDSGSSLVVSNASSIDQDVTSTSTTVAFKELDVTDTLTSKELDVTDTLTSEDGVITKLDVINSLKVPTGATATVGINADGSIRYNNSTGEYEGYIQNGTSGNWVPFNRVSDEDGDTYIEPQTAKNTDEDTLNFYTGGTKVGYISETEFKFDVPIISNNNQYLHMPAGTTLQRPTIAQNSTSSAVGMMRFNTDLKMFEGHNGIDWVGVSGLIDSDRDTYISAESAPGEDEDTLSFMIGNTNGASTTAMTITDGLILAKQPVKATIGAVEVPVGGKLVNTFTNTATFTTAQIQNDTGLTNSGVVAGNRYLEYDHDLGERWLIVQVYEFSTGRQIIPDEIHLINSNRVLIDVSSFPQPSPTGNKLTVVLYV